MNATKHTDTLAANEIARPSGIESGGGFILRYPLFSAVVLLLVICLLPASPLLAQVSNLDKATLIEGLRREGMRDLLRHMMETEPSEDPVLARQVLINLQRLDYENLAQAAARASDPAEAERLRNESVEIFERVRQEYRDLIASFRDHEQRPLWQTELGELLLIEYLQVIHTNAPQFQEFGVPTTAQRDAFHAAVTEAVTLMHDADYRLFQLQTELPRTDNHTQLRVDTGLWDRMMTEYYGVRTPFSLAHAAYYATLLPDSAEYYQNLGDGRIVQQRATPAEERARLLALAAERIQKLIDDHGRDYDILPASKALLGRVHSAAGNQEEAIVPLEEVIATSQPTLDHLTASLGRVIVLERQGQGGEAMNELYALGSHPLVTGNLLLRLLLTDTQHMILLRRAEAMPSAERGAGVSAAYAPYVDLMNDPSLGSQAEALRTYVYRRWTASIDAAQSLADVPSAVVAAMAQMLRMEGQNLVIEADEASNEQAGQLLREASGKLRRVIEMTDDLLRRADLGDAVMAQAMFNKAYATFFLNRRDNQTTLNAAGILIDLTEQFPSQPVAREAIASATTLLQPLHARGADVNGEYVRAMKVLLSEYPGSEAAQNHRLYYAMSVPLANNEYAAAAEVLDGVPPSHPTYFEAQRERLYCLVKMFEAAPQDERQALADLISRDGQRLIREADAATDGNPERAKMVRSVRGHAVLVMADIAAAQGEQGVALQRLENIEEHHVGDPELLRLGLGRRILLLAEMGRYEEAAHAANQMMRSFPGDAAAVIDRVLNSLDAEAAALRQQAAEELAARPKAALEARAAAMSETAAELAKLLVEWARTQKFSPDEMVPFDLILAKSMRLAGKPEQALEQLRPLRERFANDVDVLTETAEAMYAVGGRENLVAAANIYSRLAGGIQPTDGVYPSAYWNAWMRFFQIADRLDQNTRDIAVRVRQLEMTDRNLGGEPYYSEMKRLQSKHAR